MLFSNISWGHTWFSFGSPSQKTAEVRVARTAGEKAERPRAGGFRVQAAGAGPWPRIPTARRAGERACCCLIGPCKLADATAL